MAFSRSMQLQASTVKISAGVGFLMTAIVASVILARHFNLGRDIGACLLDDLDDSGNATLPFLNSAGSNTMTLLNSLEQRCTSLNKEMQDLQKEQEHLSTVVGLLTVDQEQEEHLSTVAASLKHLLKFDAQYADTMSFFDSVHRNASAPATISLKRSQTRVCFLQLATMARRLTASLPRGPGNANGALSCHHGALSQLEERAVREAEREETPRALAALGMFWGELIILGRSAAPIFGSGPVLGGLASSQWERDSWGTLAPVELVYAEALLLRSSHSSGRKRAALSGDHAARLQEHAKFLESQDHHEAAANRYQAMGKVAERAGLHAIAAQAQSQLSHSLKMRGAYEEAIVAAKAAVDLTMNPLAQFVLATARLSSGLLTTDASLKVAEGQLRAVAGLLPSDELEVQRKKMHSEMMMWSWISKGDVLNCRVVPDAARFLICAICKFIF